MTPKQDPTCEEFPKPVTGVKSQPCGRPACFFYAIYNGVGGVQFFTARCENHPREKDEDKLFDAKRITREEFDEKAVEPR